MKKLLILLAFTLLFCSGYGTSDAAILSGDYSCSLRGVSKVEDSYGNDILATSTQTVIGKIYFYLSDVDGSLEQNQNGNYIEVYDSQNNLIIGFDEFTGVSSHTISGKSDSILLIATGHMATYQESVVYMNIKGRINRDSYGNNVSLGLGGTIAGGASDSDDFIFTGKFKSVLTPMP